MRREKRMWKKRCSRKSARSEIIPLGVTDSPEDEVGGAAVEVEAVVVAAVEGVEDFPKTTSSRGRGLVSTMPRKVAPEKATATDSATRRARRRGIERTAVASGTVNRSGARSEGVTKRRETARNTEAKVIPRKKQG